MVRETYLHGHHASVLRSHAWRTAENSAGYLLDRLRPGDSVLDVGCGPATITIDLARRVDPGGVVGVEPGAEAVAVARRSADDAGNPANLSFQLGDVYALPFPEAAFDVVHAHQVLQHLADPVAAVREMRRVCRPGGTLAVRDADYGAMRWSPQHPGLDRWQQVYRDTARALGAEPDAGRWLQSWGEQAGLDDVTASDSVWRYASTAEITWWSQLWADRMLHSQLHSEALRHDIATEEELTAISRSWREWGVEAGAWFVVPHGEVLARRW